MTLPSQLWGPATGRCVAVSIRAAVVMLPAACGDAPASPAPDAKPAAVADAAVPDAPTDGTAADTARGPESEDAGPADVGKPCTSNPECSSGLCVPGFAGSVCSMACTKQADCPQSWRCGPHPGGGPAMVCLPRDALLCAPCAKDADCQALGETSARCVADGPAGSFCGIACATAGDCPTGADCVATAGGLQCRPANGAPCTCGALAKAGKATTACTSSNSFGSCPGKRSCGDGGLSACDAPAAASETCNDLDDDCDGQTDEGVCACKNDADCAAQDDGKLCNGKLVCDAKAHACKLDATSVVTCPVNTESCQTTACQEPVAPAIAATCVIANLADGLPCDDKLAATSGETCVAGVCGQGVVAAQCTSTADCAKLEDGNLCNGTLFCNQAKKVCQVNPVTIVYCPTVADTACSKNACQPATGLCAPSPINAGKPCDDGNVCTAGETCANGTCASPTNTCACTATADCAKYEDGNLCNGTLYCHKATATCLLDPTKVVVCPTGLDTACSKNTCEPKTGTCAPKPVADGAPCDADGNVCSASDACNGGKCAAGANVCACQTDAECASKNDGDGCNGTLYCDKLTKQCAVNAATVVTCPTGLDTACVHHKCNPVDGQCSTVTLPAGSTCTDGNACVAPSLCGASGACLPGAATSCDDNSPCTADACNNASGCVHTPIAATCTDGDVCTVGDTCAGGQCKPGGLLSCDDSNPCTDDACAVGLGCAATPNGAGCSDGNACTAGDACKGGTCGAGVAVVCKDTNPCTTDTCDKAKGCTAVILPDCVSCATAAACGDGNGCTAEFCVGGLCSVQALDGAPCDDGTACTKPDTCLAKACQAGKVVTCDDAKPCTDDSCDSKAGCQFVPTAKPCDADGSVCTVSDACSGGSCVAGSPKTCDDGNLCTDDACDAIKGCTTLANSKPCDADGSLCTAQDGCANGKCTAGAALACDDTNPCTDDSCEVKTGCKHVPTTLACNDGDACTVGETCQAGACKGNAKPLLCNDDKPCTADSCAPTSGCVFDAAKAEGQACTVLPNGVCAAGACAVCGSGFEVVTVDVDGAAKSVCSALGPVWGARPIQPVGVYTVQVLAGDKVVVDSQTQLMWQQGIAPQAHNWANAKAYCNGLALGGHKDWRLPSLAELSSLLDYTVVGPGLLIDTSAFAGTKAGSYWSASLRAGSTTSAWNVWFNAGDVYSNSVTSSREVRCVRGGLNTAPAPRFVVSPAGGTVADNWTKLNWQRDILTNTQSWQKATEYCAALQLEGGGWRMPTVTELRGIVDVQKISPPIDGTAFPKTQTNTYFSATPLAGSTKIMWAVYFAVGESLPESAANNAQVRCVR